MVGVDTHCRLLAFDGKGIPRSGDKGVGPGGGKLATSGGGEGLKPSGGGGEGLVTSGGGVLTPAKEVHITACNPF